MRERESKKPRGGEVEEKTADWEKEASLEAAKPPFLHKVSEQAVVRAPGLAWGALSVL